MADYVLPVAGTLIGGYIGSLAGPAGTTYGATIGAAIGGAAGSYAAARMRDPLHTEGSRLEDLRSTAAGTPGKAIPIIYGTMRVPGEFIVVDDLTEIKNTREVGGKGLPGNTQTDYSYTLTYAVLYGIPYGGSSTLLKRFDNKELVEDYGTKNSDYIDPVQSLFSGVTLDDETPMTYYDGSQTEADADLEAIIGSGNVPAYKGYAYGVAKDVDLTGRGFGNSPPLVEAVISTSVTENPDDLQYITADSNGTYLVGYSSATGLLIYYRDSSGMMRLSAVASGNGSLVRSRFESGSSGVVAYLCGAYGYRGDGQYLWVRHYSAGQFRVDIIDTATLNTVHQLVGSEIPSTTGWPIFEVEDFVIFRVVTGGASLKAINKSTYAIKTLTPPTGYNFVDVDNLSSNERAVGTGGNSFIAQLVDSGDSTIRAMATYTWSDALDTWVSGAAVVYTDSMNVSWLIGEPMVAASGYIYALFANKTTGANYLAKFSSALAYDSNVSLPLTDQGVNWHGASHYEESTDQIHYKSYTRYGIYDCASDTIASDWTAGGTASSDDYLYYDKSNNTYRMGSQSASATVMVGLSPNRYDADLVTTASIVDDLMSRCGLTSADYDTSNLVSSILGFSHTQRDGVPSSLSALMTLGVSYSAINDWKITPQPMGASSVRTISTDEMGVVDPSEGRMSPLDVRDPSLISRPKRLELRYLSPGLNYQERVVTAENPTETNSLTINYSFAAALEDDTAQELAQTLLQRSAELRTFGSMRFMPEHRDLEPGDVITIADQTSDVDRVVQLTRVAVGANGIVEADGVAYDSRHITSTVVGVAADAGVTGLVIPFNGVPQLLYVDSPLLRDNDDGDQPGPYIIGYAHGGFSNSSVWWSSDDSAYNFAGPIPNSAVVGYSDTEPSAVDFEAIDTTNTVRVTLFDKDATLASTTQSQMVSAGVNAALWGQPGRWEIIQFQTATLVSEGVYDLTNLLRGRRGTDFEMDSHVAGDTFVLLDSATAIRITAGNFTVGDTYNYKILFPNDALEDRSSYDAALGTIPYRPYSPIDLDVTPVLGGGFTITYTWRTRKGGSYGGDNTLTDGVPGNMSDPDSGHFNILDATDDSVAFKAATSGGTYNMSLSEFDTESPNTDTLKVRVTQDATNIAYTAATEPGTPSDYATRSWVTLSYDLQFNVNASDGDSFACPYSLLASDGGTIKVNKLVRNSAGDELEVA